MPKPLDTTPAPDPRPLADFVARVVVLRPRTLPRHPWRETRDPYPVLLSEVMLQQTQVSRVVSHWEAWLGGVPHARRARRRSARAGPARDGRVWATTVAPSPSNAPPRRSPSASVASCRAMRRALRSLPGIGPATASGVRAFAFDLPGVYLETNVRAVFLHELFADRDGVTDRELTPVGRRPRSRRPHAKVSPRDLVLRAARLRGAAQARGPQPISAKRAPREAVGV